VRAVDLASHQHDQPEAYAIQIVVGLRWDAEPLYGVTHDGTKLLLICPLIRVVGGSQSGRPSQRFMNTRIPSEVFCT
jgi:hypothetical protein